MTEVIAGDGDGMRVPANSESLTADYIVFACGYAFDLGKVSYLRWVLDSVALTDGFPMLDEHFQTTLDGLYITGYSATRDFGPFFGFVKGSPAAATLIVRDLVAKSATRAPSYKRVSSLKLRPSRAAPSATRERTGPMS